MNKGDKIRDYKLKNYIITVTAKISALLSGKIDKCKYLIDEEILLPKQHRTIQESKYSNSPLRKTL